MPDDRSFRIVLELTPKHPNDPASPQSVAYLAEQAISRGLADWRARFDIRAIPQEDDQ